MTALDQIEELAKKLAGEADDKPRSPVDFHAFEANERHEGHRQAGEQILAIIRRERLTRERIKEMDTSEILDRIHSMEKTLLWLNLEFDERLGPLPG